MSLLTCRLCAQTTGKPPQVSPLPCPPLGTPAPPLPSHSHINPYPAPDPGRVFPPRGDENRSEAKRTSHDVAWADRAATAFFRGSSTGPGVDAATNQRIRLAALSQEWAKSAAYNEANAVDRVPFLNAGIVSWNMRDRKLQGRPMTYVRPEYLQITKVARVPMYEQMKYKYHIYVEGHW